MRKTMMCTAVLCATAGATALYAVPAGAVQPSAPLALKSADTQNVETVRSRYRYHSRWYGSRWYGAAGAYAYAPGYRGYGYAGRYRGYGERYRRGCTGDETVDSAFPSWMCFGADR
jgi:hypothetical protein